MPECVAQAAQCSRPKDRLKGFVDRDMNAASNILLAGTSSVDQMRMSCLKFINPFLVL